MGDGWSRFLHTYPVVNKTWCYAFPIIGLSTGISVDEFLNLRAVFLLNEDYPELDDVLHLVFRKTENKRAELLRDRLRGKSNFLMEYYPDDTHVIVIMRIPVEYYHEFDKFMDSKYSEFSENYKRGIIKYHGFIKGDKSNGSKVIETLNKSEELYKDWERKIGEKIPRSQEANTRWDENKESILRETFTEDLKVMKSQGEVLKIE